MTIADRCERRRVPACVGVPVMLRQIYSDYHLPTDPKVLSLSEITFWYEALIPQLIAIQKLDKEKIKHGKGI